MNRKTKQTPNKREKKQKRPVKIDHASPLRRAVELLLTALFVALVVEGFNQGNPVRMLRYLAHRPLYFLVNYLVILTVMSVTLLFKRRRAITITVALLWIALGFAN